MTHTLKKYDSKYISPFLDERAFFYSFFLSHLTYLKNPLKNNHFYFTNLTKVR